MSKGALVIGESSGIGKATAEKLLKEGIELQVVGTNAEKLGAFKNGASENLVTHKVDITYATEMDSLNSGIREWDNLDYLVNASVSIGLSHF